jgi:alpha-L-fucosidase 2
VFLTGAGKQINGKKIMLLPAWPNDRDADFKLHVYYRAAMQGKIIHGKLTGPPVSPAGRITDIGAIPHCSYPG